MAVYKNAVKSGELIGFPRVEQPYFEGNKFIVPENSLKYWSEMWAWKRERLGNLEKHKLAWLAAFERANGKISHWTNYVTGQRLPL